MFDESFQYVVDHSLDMNEHTIKNTIPSIHLNEFPSTNDDFMSDEPSPMKYHLRGDILKQEEDIINAFLNIALPSFYSDIFWWFGYLLALVCILNPLNPFVVSCWTLINYLILSL